MFSVSDLEVKQVRTAARIIDTVEKLTKKYDTRDPYELCKCLGIKIHFYDMEKKLKGFFFYQSRQKNIVIDSNVNEVLERILVAHELGHAVLHTKIAMMKGFQEMEVLDSGSPEEDEANFFEYSCAGVPLFRRNGYRQSSGRKPLIRNRDTTLN